MDVGCDSVLFFGGEVLGKPGTAEVAREWWHQMSGDTGELFTGHAVLRLDDGTPTKEAAATETTVVRFASPTEHELDAT